MSYSIYSLPSRNVFVKQHDRVGQFLLDWIQCVWVVLAKCTVYTCQNRSGERGTDSQVKMWIRVRPTWYCLPRCCHDDVRRHLWVGHAFSTWISCNVQANIHSIEAFPIIENYKDYNINPPSHRGKWVNEAAVKWPMLGSCWNPAITPDPPDGSNWSSDLEKSSGRMMWSGMEVSDSELVWPGVVWISVSNLAPCGWADCPSDLTTSIGSFESLSEMGKQIWLVELESESGIIMWSAYSSSGSGSVCTNFEVSAWSVATWTMLDEGRITGRLGASHGWRGINVLWGWKGVS